MRTGTLIGGPGGTGRASRPPVPPPGRPVPSRPLPSLPVRPPAPAPENGQACRCGAPPVGECSECERPVCDEHSELWRGWRVCDRDLADARIRARAAAAEEERRAREAAAAAEAERERRRRTLLDLSPEDALWTLYVEEPRTEQEVRSAAHVLRRLSPEAFTRLCLDELPEIDEPMKGRRSRLRRLRGWPFAGPDYHDRSWFLTRSGDWYRSGSYGDAGAEQGHFGRKVRLDDTEKRAIVYELSWQQERNGFLA